MDTDSKERSKSQVKIAMLEADIDRIERHATTMRSEIAKLRENKHVEDNNVKVGIDRLNLAETSAMRESSQLAETVEALKRLTDKLSQAQERCLNAEQEKVSGGMLVLQERVSN